MYEIFAVIGLVTGLFGVNSYRINRVVDKMDKVSDKVVGRAEIAERLVDIKNRLERIERNQDG